MRHSFLYLALSFVLLSLSACGGGGSVDSASSGGTATSSNITLPSSVQVVSAH